MNLKKKKILILGASGMLGSELTKVFEKFNLVSLTHKDLDITKKKKLFKRIKKIKPDIIINATGYTNVEKAKKEKNKAEKVNGLAVGYLGEITKKINGILIHFSTDYVFNGRKKTGFKEKDEPKNPLNTYGKTKLIGENLIRELPNLKFYLIRTSWLFGKNGRNFVKTILKLAWQKKRKKLKLSMISMVSQLMLKI